MAAEFTELTKSWATILWLLACEDFAMSFGQGAVIPSIASPQVGEPIYEGVTVRRDGRTGAVAGRRLAAKPSPRQWACAPARLHEAILAEA